jgi:putative ABC transport system permease protein
MTFLKQLGSVTALGLKSVPARPGESVVVIIGVAMVVAVFVSVFGMAAGFEKVTAQAGHANRAVVLGSSADSESASDLSREAVQLLENTPGIRRTPNGSAMLSAEALAFVPLMDKSSGLDASVTVRGVGAAGLAMRPEIHLVEGRTFHPGSREVIVGRAVQQRMVGANVGNAVGLPDGDWQITGVFESGGDARESEVLTDSETLLTAFRRKSFNVALMTLDSVDAFQAAKDAIASNPRLTVNVVREDAYVAQSTSYVRGLLRAIALGIGGIMALGAAFGAINTMYSSVSTRSTEIATLRAMGFHPAAVVASVLVESMLLALVGALIGAALAWLFFSGAAVSTLTGSSAAQVTYSLQLTAGVFAAGVLLACAIGLFGGLFPAVRAGTQPIALGMRKG